MSRQPTADSRQPTADSRQPTADSRQPTADSRQPTASSSGNQALSKAKSAKQDEFYTQLGDIENELKHYKTQLRGKTIFCNCDDPFESNFFKYFALNFNTLGLKKLIATSHVKSPIAGAYLPLYDMEGLKPEGKQPYAIEINEVPDHNGDGATDLADVEYIIRHNAKTSWSLKGDEQFGAGDFRSRECVELLKQADIVVTNPPFSLFREFVGQLVEYGKQFLIIGNMNATTYKGFFTLIRDGKIWYGASINSGDREFGVPDDYPLDAAGFRVDKDDKKYIRVKGVRWYTNLDHSKRHENLPLYKKYSAAEYPKYDNYNAIEVSKYASIPCDYFDVIGVPITFLDHYNPDQFVILGCNRDIDQDVTRYYGRSTILNGKETFKRLFIKRKVSS
jgi:Adenine-specific methyltransferase EcoRI